MEMSQFADATGGMYVGVAPLKTVAFKPCPTHLVFNPQRKGDIYHYVFGVLVITRQHEESTKTFEDENMGINVIREAIIDSQVTRL